MVQMMPGHNHSDFFAICSLPSFQFRFFDMQQEGLSSNRRKLFGLKNPYIKSLDQNPLAAISTRALLAVIISFLMNWDTQLEHLS